MALTKLENFRYQAELLGNHNRSERFGDASYFHPLRCPYWKSLVLSTRFFLKW